MNTNNFDKCHSCEHFSGSSESCREGYDPCTCEKELAESDAYNEYQEKF